MSTEVEASDWADIDRWWSAYRQTRSVAQSHTTPRVFGMDQLTQCWDSLDPWWETYAETGHETAVSLADLLIQANEEWNQADGPFDTDPLAANLTGRRFQRGPLQPSNEVDWSRWLAQLITPSAALVTELFDISVNQAPSEVIREDRLSKQDGSYRRPDILLNHEDCGVSIEVKLGDENYRKTAETAGLVEHHYDDREWVHALLLPKSKKNRLDSIVEPSIRTSQDGQPHIMWDDPGPINVIYWRDVCAAVRSLLRRGDIVDDHWAANAYLFCATVEQQIMDFQSQPVIERLADPTGVVDTLRPIGIADTLEEQLIYLRERPES